MLLEFASQRGGRREDAPDRRVDIQVDRIDGDIATAMVRCHRYVDHLHLIRTAAGLKILNILWRPRHSIPRPP